MSGSFGSARLGSKGVKVIWKLMSQKIKVTREMYRWFGSYLLGRCMDGLLSSLGRCLVWLRKIRKCRGCVILLVLILSALDKLGRR